MKDVESLRNLGIEGSIVQLNVGKPLLEFCTTMFEGYEGVVILTDWDDKGNTLCRIIKQHLKSCDIPFDTRIFSSRGPTSSITTRSQLLSIARSIAPQAKDIPSLLMI